MCMKTCKKLFTLALALILLMSVLVLPAMAEAETSHVHTDTIQPRVPAVVCPYCGGNAVYFGRTNGVIYYRCNSCNKIFK